MFGAINSTRAGSENQNMTKSPATPIGKLSWEGRNDAPLSETWKFVLAVGMFVGCDGVIVAAYVRVRMSSGSPTHALSAMKVSVYSPAMFTGGAGTSR